MRGVLATWKTGSPMFMTLVDVGPYYFGPMQVRRVGLMEVWYVGRIQGVAPMHFRQLDIQSSECGFDIAY